MAETGYIFFGGEAGRSLPYPTVTYSFAAESPGVLANSKFGVFTLEE